MIDERRKEKSNMIIGVFLIILGLVLINFEINKSAISLSYTGASTEQTTPSDATVGAYFAIASSELISQKEINTSYVKGESNIFPGNSNYYRFWLDIPAAQAAGTYNNTVTFKAV